MNLHDVHELDCTVMNDVDEKLMRQERESEVWRPEDDGHREDDTIDVSDIGATASAFNIGFVDPEERALLDLLEIEGRSSVESLLQKDFFPLPQFMNTRATQDRGRRTQSWEKNENDFLGPFLDDESFIGRLDDARVVAVADSDNDMSKDVPQASEQCTLETLKRAVAG